jgi:hypothetical protein
LEKALVFLPPFPSITGSYLLNNFVRTGASPALMLPADFPKSPQSTYGVGRISEQTKPPLINCSNLFKRTCASLNAFTTRCQIKHEPLEVRGNLGQLAHGFKMRDRTVSQIHLLVLELPLTTDCQCRHRGMSGETIAFRFKRKSL